MKCGAWAAQADDRSADQLAPIAPSAEQRRGAAAGRWDALAGPARSPAACFDVRERPPGATAPRVAEYGPQWLPRRPGSLTRPLPFPLQQRLGQGPREDEEKVGYCHTQAARPCRSSSLAVGRPALGAVAAAAAGPLDRRPHDLPQPHPTLPCSCWTCSTAWSSSMPPTCTACSARSGGSTGAPPMQGWTGAGATPGLQLICCAVYM